MIQLSISQLLIIIIFIIILFILYSFYHIRKGFLFFKHVLEANQQQLINQQKQIDHHEQILQALTGISSPSFSSNNLTQDISNSMTSSHPSHSSSNHFNLPSGIMGNIFHLINNVASTPPNPENIIEQEMKEYIKESSIEKELESELNELKDSTNNSSINEGRLDELSISSQNSDSSHSIH